MVLSGFLDIFGTNISKRMPRPLRSTRFQCPELPLKDHVSGDRFQAAKYVAPVFSSTFLRAKILYRKRNVWERGSQGNWFLQDKSSQSLREEREMLWLRTLTETEDLNFLFMIGRKYLLPFRSKLAAVVSKDVVTSVSYTAKGHEL